MELALYHPELGYYESPTNSPGRRGDFYTSVSTGDLFGQLLACQFARWLEDFSTVHGKYWIIEAGAHDGRLAGDILNWLQSRRPGLFARLEYAILEPSPRRQKWQRETLNSFGPIVRWINDFKQLSVVTGHASVQGVIFSNELLDAMPVHRFGWDAGAKKWFEWGVALDGNNFVWARLDNSKFKIQNSKLEAVLPDGYIIETSPAAGNWWRQAAGVLQHGKLLTLDYGHTGDELFAPARTRGTLRAYARHHVSDDLLANPGEQDLTAHVNFSTIQKTGEAAGLKTEFFGRQEKFLTQILSAAAKANVFDPWDVKQTRQFQTLTHPEHLGRSFRVLVQAR